MPLLLDHLDLSQLNLLGFICSSASLEVLLCEPRPDIDTLLCIVWVWNA